MLEELFAGSIADAQSRREVAPIDKVERAALSQAPAIDALEFLAAAAQIKILAEVKRASPSRGQMAEISDPAALAKIYADNGASAISVLTEERKFKGSLDDLIAVREKVSVPLLRKDFIANEYQILEARAAGADIILTNSFGGTRYRLKLHQAGKAGPLDDYSINTVAALGEKRNYTGRAEILASAQHLELHAMFEPA